MFMLPSKIFHTRHFYVLVISNTYVVSTVNYAALDYNSLLAIPLKAEVKLMRNCILA